MGVPAPEAAGLALAPPLAAGLADAAADPAGLAEAGALAGFALAGAAALEALAAGALDGAAAPPQADNSKAATTLVMLSVERSIPRGLRTCTSPKARGPFARRSG